MSINNMPRSQSRVAALRQGFTLVELLTVIAIIALLAAIIFPVYGQVRENARRTACISNMQKLYQATRQFELDNRRYPEYLFGPVLARATGLPVSGNEDAFTMEEVAGLLRSTVTSSTPQDEATVIRNAQRTYRWSLFPEYINNLADYHCPNNTQYNDTRTAVGVTVQRLEKDPANPNASALQSVPYYGYDSYDANPAITGAGQEDPTNYKARYSRVWYSLLNRENLSNLPSADRALYKNQLVFSNPSADTYMTMCTYHAEHNKIIVMWLNGNAKVLDVRRLQQFPNTNQGNVPNDYDFFKMTPTNN